MPIGNRHSIILCTDESIAPSRMNLVDRARELAIEARWHRRLRQQ
jgi:hypothetical protein